MHGENGTGMQGQRGNSRYHALVASGLAGAAVLVGAVAFISSRPPSLRPAPSPKTVATAFSQDGFRVAMELDDGRSDTVTTGSSVDLRFTVAEDWTGGQPLAGLFPMVWLVRRDDGEGTPNRDQCKRLIRSLLAGRLARQAEVDLNKYYLVTLDDNNSITLIDPQIASSKTKTLGMVSLAGKGADFVAAPDRDTVFVSLPANGRIAAASVSTLRARYIDTGGHPRRLALQPDARLLWAGDLEGSAVTAVDVHERKLLATIDVGPGPHELAFRADSRRVFVAGPGAAEIHIIDSHTLTRTQRVTLAAPVIGLAASAHSRNVYAALARGGVAVLDDDSGAVTRVIPMPAPPTYLAASPDGRWVFVLARAQDRLFIIDTAVDQVVHTVATQSAPERVDFSPTFAYLRHRDTAHILLVDLGTLDRQPQVSDVVMGQQPPVRETGDNIAPPMVLLPEGGGALLLNERDRSVYHFMEGMSAPMGSYALYPWPARGVLLLDRSLRETAKGQYQSEFRAPPPGTYTVAFLVPGSPQINSCELAIEVTGMKSVNPGSTLRLEPLFAGQVFAPGIPTALDLRLHDPVAGEPVSDIEDLVVLVFRGPRWQWRGRARPLGDGRYRTEVRLPEPGTYTVMIEARSHGVRFGDLPRSQVVSGANNNP